MRHINEIHALLNGSYLVVTRTGSIVSLVNINNGYIYRATPLLDRTIKWNAWILGAQIQVNSYWLISECILAQASVLDLIR